ncbi:coadhesin-like [Gigantopelta aegis]|uniref:coadhesin-like n=1 Tax=Gigantopelta aegis TaxID=1735272 RepID=UPI001B888A06|nr:coadhesin-like [Gigantopelta aegis]
MPVSQCSVTCGRGLKKVKYNRKCNNPPPSNGGRPCSGMPHVIVHQYCYTGRTCPTSQVNGGWSEWKNAVATSDCSVTCGTGNQNFRVSRTCDNPRPSNGGRPCTGSATATVTKECRTNVICQVAVNGGWSDWKNPVPVSGCSVTCGSGTRNLRLSRTCDNPPPSNGGRQCSGSTTAIVTRTCNTNVACTVLKVVNGGWSDWKNPVPVSGCSVTCGSGTRNFRLSRTCDNPPPSNGGRQCTGSTTAIVTRTCNTNIACAVAVNGGWSDWKNPISVSGCSVTCGSGTRNFRLSRTCDNPPPSNGGRQCSGSTTSTVTRTCNTNVACPEVVNGGWSDWKNPVPVSGCSVTCGSGTRNVRLSRTCDNPPPSNGGRQCSGSTTSTVTRTCNTNVACPEVVNGGWSDWKNPVPVSGCSVTCGSGTRNFRLSRTCDNPPPSNGGRRCSGSTTSTVTRTCNTNVACPGSCGRSVLGLVPTSKIVGGVSAQEKEFPWQAAVLLNGFLQCGGVLIDELHVLTAGHCLENGGRVSVQLGKHYVDDAKNGNMQVIQAANYKLHEQFRQPTGLLNDIAMITLETPASINDYVKPICIPDASMVLNYNRFGIASGFGLDASSQNGGRQPSELNKVSLQMYDSESCRRIFSETIRVVGPGVICASNGMDGGKDSCQGDSGGPLMADINGVYFLFGLVSTGRGCAQPGETGFYTKVHYYSDWIKANS